MANDKDFILKNAIEVGGSTKVTIGSAPASGSVTVGYDLSVAAYDSKSLPVSSSESRPLTVAISSDGTKLYVAGQTGDAIDQWTLSTAFDVSSGTYDSVTFSYATTAGTNVQGMFFKPDGTKFYLTDDQNNKVYAYTMSAAWDLSTASHDTGDDFSVAAQTIANTNGIAFNSTGTKFLTIGSPSGVKTIFQYNLSTAWDITSASYSSNYLNISGQTGADAGGIQFNSDDTEFYVTSGTADDIFQYNMTTAGDLSSASYSNVSFSTAPETSYLTAMYFGDSGSKLYVCSFSNDTIYQYSTGSTLATATFDTSTGNYFTHTPSADSEYGFSNAGDVQTFQLEVTGAEKGYELSGAAYDSVSFSVSGQDTTPYGVAFNNDGTKMYMTGSVSASIYQYSLSTGFDLSTASYDSVSFSVSSQNSGPNAIAFNSDGTKFFLVGFGSTAIRQYSLSTAFDLSTASYDSVSFNVSSQETSPRGIDFNNTGTKMYILGTSSDSVHQYSLSTAFDLSTASYDSVSFSVSSQSGVPLKVVFNPSGTKMFMLDFTNASVFQYSLSAAFDVSTASYDNVSFAITSQDSSPLGVNFNSDGTKMYIVGTDNDSVYQYSTGSAYTITWDADIEWGGGTAPSSPAANQKDLYTITTDDGGTTYFGVPSGVAFS